jgi:hypothetical protein
MSQDSQQKIQVQKHWFGDMTRNGVSYTLNRFSNEMMVSPSLPELSTMVLSMIQETNIPQKAYWY